MSYQNPLSPGQDDKYKSAFTLNYSTSQAQVPPATGMNPTSMSFATSQVPLAGGFPAVPASAARTNSAVNILQQTNAAVKFMANEANSLQVKLKSSAQYVSGIVQREQLVPDLAELLNGYFSREYLYDDEARPILHYLKHSLIPEALLGDLRQGGEGSCFMGLFPEINRAWLIANNSLSIWDYENNRDLSSLDNLDQPIIEVGLVKPKDGIFVDAIEFLLVVVTPQEISLYGVEFYSPDTLNLVSGVDVKEKKNRDYGALHMRLHETGLKFPADEVNMVSVCGTSKGRIFLAGSDGNIYELAYQSDESWFSGKCRKINRTSSALSYIVPTFLKLSSDRTKISKLVVDESRNILYGITEDSTIQVYWLGPNGTSFESLGSSGDLVNEATKLIPSSIMPSRKSLEIVSVHPVSQEESRNISLVAVCRSGIRLYFSTITGNVFMSSPSTVVAPQCLRLVHVRAPPEENRIRDPKKLVHRWSPNLNCAFYSDGVTLASSAISAEADALMGLIINPASYSNSSIQRLPLEYSVESQIEGKIWAIEEVRGAKDSNVFKGPFKEFSMAHLVPRRVFVILTNVGSFFYSKMRPVDQLSVLLTNKAMGFEQLQQFFDMYGHDQASAFCISICCGTSSGSLKPSESSYQLVNSCITTLLKLGGEPRILNSRAQMQTSMNQGLGRVLVSSPEIENSPMHDGFYLYFSRLVSSIWKTPVWSLNSMSANLILDLHKFVKFMDDNLNLFTENRSKVPTSVGMNGAIKTEEQQLSHQNAVEWENESLKALKHLASLTIEILSFLTMTMDYKLLDALRNEPMGVENANLDIESLVSSAKGKSFIAELGNILIQKQLKMKAPVSSLCDAFRNRCPTFFSEDDVILQEGMESLNRSKNARSLSERYEYLAEALQCFIRSSKVISATSIGRVFGEFDSQGFQNGTVQLGLRYVETLDPENFGWLYYKNPEIHLDSEHHEIIRQRDHIYEKIFESIESTGFDAEKTNAVFSSTVMNSNVDEIRQKCLSLASASKDELFHIRFYDWLVKNRHTPTLLDLPPTAFLSQYLKNTFVARLDTHRDLLWKWLAKSRKLNAAAAVLFEVACSREYAIDLNKRIEYLSLAVAHSKSASSGLDNTDSSGYSVTESSVDLQTIEEHLEVAYLQLDLVNELLSSKGPTDTLAYELSTTTGLLTVTELFNSHARPNGMVESCLKLINCAALSDENLVAKLWQDLIVKIIGSDSDTVDMHKMELLGRKVAELGKKFYPSPYAFPLGYLLDLLGRLAIHQKAPHEWLVNAFITAGIPFTTVFDELHKVVSSTIGKTWTAPNSRIFGLSMLSYLLNKWAVDSSQKDALFKSKFVVSRVETYLQWTSDLQVPELSAEFSVLLRKLQNRL